jgi:hypothetical protein
MQKNTWHTIMKKQKSNLLILLAVLILIVIGIYALTFDYTKYKQASYIAAHKEKLYIKDNYTYDFTRYEIEDMFASFVSIEFENKEDVIDLEKSLKKDKNIARLNSVEYVSSNFLTEEYDRFLPFELDCDCYNLYVINASQSRGGYLYHVYVYEKSVFVYSLSR